MLLEGGSAVDAAIAADAVLGVVEPMATSIGGDLLAMICVPGEPVDSYNGTGRAPALMDPDRVAQMPGRRIPERHPWSVTVPGAIRGWSDLHRKYGRLPWPHLFAAAIRHARDGFPVASVAAREWALFDHVLHAQPYCARLYRAGRPPIAHETFRNPELAHVLEMVAQEGPDFFYEGSVADAAAEAVQSLGGLLQASDFHKHYGAFCIPLSAAFRQFTIHQCPPNTHGQAILEALTQLPAELHDPTDPDNWIQLIEATDAALARASRTVADPSGNTVCTVVVDGEGLAITLMSSIFKRFGSGIAVPGAGFVLQNRGFGFAQPGHVNGPGPSKRPYHTVVPSISTVNGHFHLGLGVVGGLMQPQGQIQILTRTMAWSTPLPEAVAAPRLRLEGGRSLAIEEGMPDHIAHALRAAGFCAPQAGTGELGGRSDFGGAHAVARLADGSLLGVADPRKDGVALAC